VQGDAVKAGMNYVMMRRGTH